MILNSYIAFLQEGKKVMTEHGIMELLTEGTQEDRTKFLRQKGNSFYRYVNTWGEEGKECILVNEAEIREDTAWLKKQNKLENCEIDLELACAYQKDLEEWYLEILMKMDMLSNRIHSLCVAIRKEQKPQYDYMEGDNEEEKATKTDYRVVYHNAYKKLVITDIAANLKKSTEDIYNYLNGQKLYRLRKLENYEDGFIDNLSSVVETVVTQYWNMLETNEKSYMYDWEEKEEEKRKSLLIGLKRQARRLSYKEVFLNRTWNVETWMELIFCKFYQELNWSKPKVDRKKWIDKETKKWFYIEEKSENVWRLTREAVLKLEELKEEERQHLMNYKIVPDISMYKDINEKMNRCKIKREYLEKKAGISEKGIYKRLMGMVKVMEPFTACILWKECKLFFKEFFQITEVETPNEEAEFRSVCRKVLDDTATLSDRIFNPERFEKNFNENNFWYTPMFENNPIEINIWLDNLKKVKLKVIYATFLMEPLVIELPFSGVMKSIEKFDQKKIAEITSQTGYETKEEILQYCGEIMARNYCKIFLGISYEVFQKIKRNICVKNIE